MTAYTIIHAIQLKTNFMQINKTATVTQADFQMLSWIWAEQIHLPILVISRLNYVNKFHLTFKSGPYFGVFYNIKAL